MSLGLSQIGKFALGQELEPVLPDKWFAPLSIPAVRVKSGLRADEQQFLAWSTTPSPFVATGWFEALSEPVRFLQGLTPPRQQFLAAPSRLLPNPNISGILSALETKDTFLGAGSLWNRIISGEAGVIESSFTGAQIGLTGPVITSAHVSIVIIN